MQFRTKVTIGAIVVAVVSLNALSKKAAEAELKLYKLEACGLDIDRLDAKTKNELGTMSEAEVYQVCHHSLKTKEILRMQQEVIDNLNSINQ